MVKTIGDEKIKIGLVQTKVSDNLDKNLQKTSKLIEDAAKKGAGIVCLQELFAYKYFAQYSDKKEYFKLAEKIPGEITNFLSEQAKNNKITLVGGSIYENDNGKYYNTSLIFNEEGKIICKYRKVHIPHDPRFYEQDYFSSGNLGFVHADLKNSKIAPLICYDQWFPEPARINALKGAQVIFYPTAIGWFDDLKKYEPFSAQRWEDAMRAHASMNGIFVAAVNRIGTEDELTFWGSSFVADPYGQIVARASSAKEETLVAEIDLEKVKMSQEGWRFLKNRKPNDYSNLVK